MMRSQYGDALSVWNLRKSSCHASIKYLVALIFGFSVGTAGKYLNLNFDILNKDNSIIRELHAQFSPDLSACMGSSNSSLSAHLFEISTLLRYCHKAIPKIQPSISSQHIKLHALLFREGLLPLGSPKHGVPAEKNKWGQSRPTLAEKEDWDTHPFSCWGSEAYRGTLVDGSGELDMPRLR